MGVYQYGSDSVPDLLYPNGTVRSKGFNRKSVDVNFPSRTKRPVPLTNTGGLITLEFRNSSTYSALISGVSWEFYAYGQLGSEQKRESAGSDSGMMNNAIANLNSIMDLLTTIAELPETVNMLLSAVDTVVRAAKLFSKGRIVEGLKALGKYKDMSRKNQRDARRANRLQKRTTESTVLEFNMGWKPFIGDINSSIELLNSSFEKGKKLRRTVTNSPGTSFNRKAERNSAGYQNGVLEGFQPRTTLTISGEIANSEAALLASLGVNNPAAVAWELTPYSFLVDYFIDIGNFIQALTGTAGLTNLRACYVLTSKTTYIGNYRLEKYARVIIQRKVTPVKWTLPGLKLAGHSGTQVANMAALMKQRLPRR